ncbi:MAG TPA: multiheme c-type cytochrome [Polyangiaceae bacterium]
MKAWSALLVASLGAAAACSTPAPPRPTTTTATSIHAPSSTTPSSASTATAVLPRADPALAPAQTELSGALTGDTVTETESCAGCHADASAQWRSSAHAFGSFNNPIYRVAVDRFRADVGKDASRFCAGCHDVALLVDGAMSAEVTPADPRAHGGITCRVCHGVEETRPDGNGSYVLAATPIPIPRDGDPASLDAHKARMALAPLRTAGLCGSCHRSFLDPATGNPAHLVGQDELGAWQRSAYAGSLAARVDEPVKAADCRGCHMPLEGATRGDAAAKEGKIHSHRFAGGNTWLAAMRGDHAQVEAVMAMLRSAASIDVAVATAADGTKTLPADGAPVVPGQAVTLDVVVRNEGAGHRFPGGVVDAQDTWIEVAVRDARGKLLAEAGRAQQSTGQDESAHVLRAVQGDEHGTPQLLRETHHFRAPVFNHTLAPRDAEVVRYRFDAARSLASSQLPLRVTATLRHRARNMPLARAVCADGKTARGVAFAREVRKRTDAVLDTCAPEPVTDLARAEVWLGGDHGVAVGMPPWRRLYDDGLGLLRALQEDVDSARPALERALDLVPPGTTTERAMVLQALAEVAIREGRTEEALARLDDAQALLPDHPAIPHARGAALSNVWRWREAVEPLQRASSLAPLDDTLLSHLAIAYGSADDPARALEATKLGLALTPRDADMLRVQALALERLGASAEDVARARAAFAAWRPPDDAPAVKNGCSQQFAWCALERLPVHVHPLRPGL